MSSVLPAPSVQAKGVRMLFASVICLGVSWPVMKLGLNSVTALWMVALRLLFALPVIALFVFITKKRLPRFSRPDRGLIFTVALAQFICSMGLITVCLQFIPAGTASILIYTTPLWMLVIDTLWYRQRPTVKRLLLTGISTLGVAMILFASGQPGVWLPLFGMLLASGLWALSIRRVSFHQWHGSVIDAVFWQFALASVVMLMFALLIEGVPSFSAYGWRGWLSLSYIGPIATGLGFGLMVSAGPKLAPERIVLISTLTPIIGYVSSVILLGETLLPMVVLGATVMLVALTLNALPKSALKKLMKRASI